MTSRVGSLAFNSELNCELDSHANTCVLGKHAHNFLQPMERQLTLLDMIREGGHLQTT